MMWFFVADLRKIHDSFPNSYMSLINLLQKLFPFIIDLVIFSSDLTDNWINSTLMCYLPPFTGKLFILMIIPVNILIFCFPVIRCSFFQSIKWPLIMSRSGGESFFFLQRLLTTHDLIAPLLLKNEKRGKWQVHTFLPGSDYSGTFRSEGDLKAMDDDIRKWLSIEYFSWKD